MQLRALGGQLPVQGSVAPGARLLSRARQSPGMGGGWQVLAQKGGRVKDGPAAGLVLSLLPSPD